MEPSMWAICLGVAAAFSILALINKYRDERALDRDRAALSCRHGIKRWSTINCEACAAEFKAEAEREAAARGPREAGVDWGAGRDRTAMVIPIRLMTWVHPKNVVFEQKDYGLCVLNDEAHPGSRRVAFRTQLTGELDGQVLQAWVDVDEGEALLSPEGVQSVRWRHITQKMKEMALKLAEKVG